MAHFAEINQNNTVVRVVVVDDENVLDEKGNESEQVGVAYLSSLFGGNWKQCSYNGSIRAIFPGIGTQYDPVEDIFFLPETATKEPVAS